YRQLPLSTHTSALSLHDALPICASFPCPVARSCSHPMRTCSPAAIRCGKTASAVRCFPPKAFPAQHPSTCRARMGAIPLPHLSRSEEHTSELQSRENLVCRLLLE